MLPLLEGRRVLVVDDVVSSGRSAAAVLRLLEKAGIRPVGIAVAMEQGARWRDLVRIEVRGVLRTPLLRVVEAGGGCIAD